MAKRKAKKKAKASPPKPAVRNMKPALRSLCERIKDLEEKTRGKPVVFHHVIGEAVIKVKSNQHKYGENAVAELAVGLGMNPDPKRNTLTKARYIASAWTRQDIIALMKAAKAHGNEFTLTHFLYLAPLRGEQRVRDRTRLENKVVRSGLPTRELHREIVLCTREARQSRRSGGRKPRAPKNPMACCIEMSKYSRDIKIRWKNWDEALFVKVRQVKEEEDPDLAACGIDESLRSQLKQSLQDYVELGERVQGAVKRLRSSIATVGRLLTVHVAKAKGAPKKKRSRPKTRPKGRRAAKTAK